MGRFPLAEYLAFEVLFVAFFYPTPRHTYRVVILTSMIYLAAQLYLTRETTDLVAFQYAAAFTAVGPFTFITYVLLAERSFPDNWRRVRDEVDVGADAGGLDKLTIKFPVDKEALADGRHFLEHAYDWMGPGTTKWDSTTSATIASNVPLEDLLKTHNERHVTDLTAAALEYLLHYPTNNPKTYLAAVPPSPPASRPGMVYD